MIIKGKLYLYSEQGMEGGYLGIVDENFISFTTPQSILNDNQKVYDSKNPLREGITSDTEIYVNNAWVLIKDPKITDPILNDADYKISSLYVGEEKGNKNADKRLMEKYYFKIIYKEEKADKLFGKGNWKFNKWKTQIISNKGKIMLLGGVLESIPHRPFSIPKPKNSSVTVHWKDGTTDKKRLSSTLLTEQIDFKGWHSLSKNDYIKVFDTTTNKVLCEGVVKKIPLRIFSPTFEGHFTKKSQHWKPFFINGYKAEIHRNIKTKKWHFFGRNFSSFFRK